MRTMTGPNSKYEAGDYSGAIRDDDEIIRQDPRNAVAYANLVNDSCFEV